MIEWKDQYRRKMLSYLEDISIFKEELENPIERNKGRINEWARKWNLRENIGEEEYEWMTQSGLRPGKTYANIKTHKGGWPYRFIISSIGTPIENLARWIEFHLKPLSRKHPSYIKDTGHFLNFIEELNETKGPFEPGSVLLVSRDIKDFYSSFNKKKCLEAVQILLDTREKTNPSTECVLEALEITMSSNTT